MHYIETVRAVGLRILRICCGIIVAGLIGCADALPPPAPDAEFLALAEKVEESTSRAAAYAEQAQAEREMSEKLYQEAKELLTRVEKAERTCKLVQKEVKKLKRRRKARKKKAKPKPEPKPEEPKELQYSPSDAPF